MRIPLRIPANKSIFADVRTLLRMGCRFSAAEFIDESHNTRQPDEGKARCDILWTRLAHAPAICNNYLVHGLVTKLASNSRARGYGQTGQTSQFWW